MGYAAIGRRVVSTGAFYTYVAKGRGKPVGVAAAFTAALAYIVYTIGLAVEKMADMLERWVDEGGIDGFNLAYAITLGTVTDFIDYVMPALQRRGRAQTSYAPGNFRRKLIGTPDGRMESTHPAAQFQGPYAGRESVADKTTDSNFAHEKASIAAE